MRWHQGWLPVLLTQLPFVGACFTDTEFWPINPPQEEPTCAGQCAPSAGIAWSDPVLLWMGTPGEAPSCPPSAPTIGYEGFSGLGPLPVPCPACECGPPMANCEMPLQWFAFSNSNCNPNLPSASKTFTSVPQGWDGTCNNDNPIPANSDCFGVPCVSAVGVEEFVFESHCEPMPSGPPNFGSGPWPWTRAARACFVANPAPCDDSNLVCAPVPPEPNTLPDRWLTCVFQPQLAHNCPQDYSEQYTFYQDIDTSNVTCKPCTCSDPPGASCNVSAAFYSDDQCAILIFGGVLPANTGDSCWGAGVPPLPIGSAIGSKSATLVVDPGGACIASGGGATTDPVLIEPATFCCKP